LSPIAEPQGLRETMNQALVSDRRMLRRVFKHAAMMENDGSADRRKACQNSTTKQYESMLGKVISEFRYDD
jgi:hypothetical protein